MLQQVLTIAATVFHLTDDTDQLGMKAVHAQVNGSTLTGLDDFLIHLLLYLSHIFLDTGRMNTSVSH